MGSSGWERIWETRDRLGSSWGGRGKRVGEEKEFNEESHMDPLLSFFLKTQK